MTDDDEHVSETDLDDDDDDDENTPPNDENVYAPSVLALRTPLSHHDTALRDITDQFFHPPSPSPVRVARPKRPAPHTVEPPHRPKKPKSLAFPADPPNWLYSRSSSSLPPSSPLPPSTANVDHAHAATARYEYHLGTPSKASDSDPFGFVAVERALKATRLPHKRISVKSPPRSTVLPPILSSLSQIEAPVPTNNEDIDGLYADEPAAGPSHVHVPVAPLLMMNSDQPHVELDETGSQPDPLRTPRKRRRPASPTPDREPDSEMSVPSSPSPVKVSVGVDALRSLRGTRTQSRAAGTKRVKKSHQHIPTPSSTPASVRRSSKQSTAPPTPVPPRRSKRQATMGARAEHSNGEDGRGGSPMKLRPRSRATAETKTTKSTARAKPAPSKSKAQTRATTTATAEPARGRPKGKPRAKDKKGKGKTRSLENVLELSDDTRERYDKERRERLKYFKRLEAYQIQKENVYVV